jgi:hypothetical protein
MTSHPSPPDSMGAISDKRESEQLHDYVLFMANIGEAGKKDPDVPSGDFFGLRARCRVASV